MIHASAAIRKRFPRHNKCYLYYKVHRVIRCYLAFFAEVSICTGMEGPATVSVSHKSVRETNEPGTEWEKGTICTVSRLRSRQQGERAREQVGRCENGNCVCRGIALHLISELESHILTRCEISRNARYK